MLHLLATRAVEQQPNDLKVKSAFVFGRNPTAYIKGDRRASMSATRTAVVFSTAVEQLMV